VLSVFPSGAEAHHAEEFISGRHFRAVQATLPELERNKLDVADSRIVIWESGTSVFVVFGDPKAPEGQMGSSGQKPGFSVELARDDLRIIRSDFVK
jgi:hypothetical protein